MLLNFMKSFPQTHVCALYLDQYFSKWLKKKKKKAKQKPNWSQCFAILAFGLCSAKHAQEVFVECIQNI